MLAENVDSVAYLGLFGEADPKLKIVDARLLLVRFILPSPATAPFSSRAYVDVRHSC